MLINNIINKIFIIYKNFNKINSINLNKYNKKIFIYYFFNIFLFSKNFYTVLLAILNMSLQFNFLVLELFSSFFFFSASSTLVFATEVLLGTVPGELLIRRIYRVSRLRFKPALFLVGRWVDRNL